MEDYPRDLLEFEARFASEGACRDYLSALRWPEGFRCPGCGHERAWPVRKVWFECARCGRQTSVTSGTIFQDTRKPLRLWFRAIWHVTSQKNGVSALGLQRVLGLGSYQTAWTWMHKLRRAMVRPGRERLAGVVEVDETYWGAEEEGVSGRQTERKALIAVAAEERGRGLGRIRMQRVRNASAASLMPFVEESVEPGSVVHTDGWLGYEPREAIAAQGYRGPTHMRMAGINKPAPVEQTVNETSGVSTSFRYTLWVVASRLRNRNVRLRESCEWPPSRPTREFIAVAAFGRQLRESDALRSPTPRQSSNLGIRFLVDAFARPQHLVAT